MAEQGPASWVSNLAEAYRTYAPPPEAVGMTTQNELCFVECFAREAFTGKGRIVDLGVWYGATTAALARGLQQNAHANRNRCVEAFDLFTWQKWMTRHAHRVEHLGVHEENESFLADVRNLLRAYADVVRLEERDLSMTPTRPEAPIEFLFVDAQKSWRLGQAIGEAFFPALVPNSSYVVQQDFVWYHPTVLSIHMLMWYLRDHFEFVHHVPGSCSVAFRCTKAMDLAEGSLPGPESFTSDMINEAYDWCLGHAEIARHDYLKAGKLFLLVDRAEYEPAVDFAEEFLSAERKIPPDLLGGMATVLQTYCERAERKGLTTAVAPLQAIAQLLSRRTPSTGRPSPRQIRTF